MGNLRGCNTPFASRVKSEEGRTGALGRRLGYDYEERLGITSNVVITTAAALLSSATKSYTHTTQVESFEAPLEVTGLRDASIPFMGIFIRAPVRSIFFSEASLSSGASVCSRLSRNSSKRRTNTPSRSFLAFPTHYFHITHPMEVPPRRRWSRSVKDDTF